MKRSGKQAGVAAADYEAARKRQAERHDTKVKQWFALVEPAAADLAAPAKTLGDLVEEGQELVETDPPHPLLQEGFRRLALHPNLPESVWHWLIYYGHRETLAENAAVPLVLLMNGGELEQQALQMLVLRLADEQKAFLKKNRAALTLLVEKADRLLTVDPTVGKRYSSARWTVDTMKSDLQSGVQTEAIKNIGSVYGMVVADDSVSKKKIGEIYPAIRQFAHETASLGMPQSRWFAIKTG